ncbi:recombinase family protein [Microvirga arabica]|uniref:recombinase family protein n=1 Tax=Microvirga arabica TaxID=1128671 RepID=UPI0019393E5F|nr:recombinase family protein [Microvirga arabica]MBM1169863.1 recombinase family protein [Microvirga arabica]
MPDAYSYVRFSTPAQMQGDSLRRQTKRSDDFAKKHGLTIVRNYHDLGVSGFRGKNREIGQLGAFLDAVKDGRIKRGSWLLVESLDRLSRDTVVEALPGFLAILKQGIIVATIQDERIYDEISVQDGMQLMGSLIVMSRAHEESRRKADLTKENWKTRREKGKKQALCPAWLRLLSDGQTYECIPERVKILEEIFQMCVDGMGSYTIAKILNERGVDPFSKKLDGKPRAGKEARGWHAGSVLDLLTHRGVLGELHIFHREGAKKFPSDQPPIKNWYPAVIDEALFLRAQAARRKGRSKGRKGHTWENLFQGIGHCNHCQGPMLITHSRNQTYLKCSNTKNGINCKEVGARYFRNRTVEDVILDHVREYKLSELFANPVTDAELRKVEVELAGCAETIGQLDKRNSNLIRLMTDLDPDDPTIADYQKVVREQRAKMGLANDLLKSLQDRRAELVAQQDYRADVEAMVLKLRQQMATEEDPTKVVAIRAKLASALKLFIDTIQFDAREGTIDVILMGGAVAYRFRRSEKKSGFKREFTYAFEQRVSLLPGMVAGIRPIEAFLGYDANEERVEKMKPLITLS